MTTPAKRRRDKAARQARWLAHQEACEVVAPVVVSDPETEMLIDLGWLERAKSEDRREVGAAIGRMLAEVAAEHLKAKDASSESRVGP
jgi:hypothetical protein